MTVLQLNADIYSSLATISQDESLLKRAAKYLKKLATAKSDPTLMTKEEFYKRIEEAEAQIERGECVAMRPGEDLTQMLKRCGYDL